MSSQDPADVPAPAANEITRVIEETEELHQEDFGSIERTVRALVGAPVAISFLFVRHFYFTPALLLLALGLYLLGSSIFHYCPIRHALYWVRWKRSAN